MIGPLPGTQHQRWDFTLRLSSSAPAAFVWLEAGRYGGRFSRNGFHITAPEFVELRFHTDDEVTAAALAQAITVTALNGRYAPCDTTPATLGTSPAPASTPETGGAEHYLPGLSVLLLALGPLAVLV